MSDHATSDRTMNSRAHASIVKQLKMFIHSRINDSVAILVTFASRVPWHNARVAVLRGLGAKISPTATLYGGFEIRAPRHLHVGARTIIGDRAILDARGGIHLGEDVNFSTEVHVWTAQHDWQSPDFSTQKRAVFVGDHTWLGPRVTVLPGSYIPSGVRVAAGAVVHGHLEPNTLYGGIPARPIATTDADFYYQLPTSRHKMWWR